MDPDPPQISPARGPPLRDDCDAHVGEGIAPEPDWATDWDGAAQAAPDYEVDQRILAVDRPGAALLRARWWFLRGQSGPAHRRSGFGKTPSPHTSLRLQPERTCALPCLCGRRGV